MCLGGGNGEVGECIGVVWIKVNGVGFVAGLGLEENFIFFYQPISVLGE